MEFLELFENNVNTYTSKIKKSKYTENTNHNCIKKRKKRYMSYYYFKK